MSLNLHQLEVFGAVAERQSVTAAATALRLSQPAVSRQVKDLESTLGVKLFERTKRGVRLTEAGTLLSTYAKQLSALRVEAESAIDDLHSLRRGALTIAATSTLATYFLPRVLVRFRLKYPGIRVRLLSGDNDALIDQLLLHEQPFALLSEAEPTNLQLKYRVFMRDALTPIVGRGARLARKRNVSADQFVDAGLVLHDEGMAEAVTAESALRAAGLEGLPSLRLASTEAIKEAVAAGLGVALLPRLSVQADLDSGRLMRVRVPNLNVTRECYQVTRANQIETRALRAFLYMVKHAARGSLPKLSDPVTPAI